MAAFLLVGFWTTVAALVVVVASPASGRPATAEAGASPIRWLVATAAGCLTLGTAVVLLLVAASPVRESTVGTWVAFFTAALFITGTAIGVLIGILRALDLMDAYGGVEAVREG